MAGRRRSRIPLPLPENANRARVNDKIRVPSVRLIDENPNKPTYVLYAGPDAKELACDLADYDLEDEEDEDDDE